MVLYFDLLFDKICKDLKKTSIGIVLSDYAYLVDQNEAPFRINSVNEKITVALNDLNKHCIITRN